MKNSRLNRLKVIVGGWLIGLSAVAATNSYNFGGQGIGIGHGAVKPGDSGVTFTNLGVREATISVGQLSGVDPETGAVITNSANLVPFKAQSLTVVGSITGNGSGLSNLNASALSGTMSSAQLPTSGVWNATALTVSNLTVRNLTISNSPGTFSDGGETAGKERSLGNKDSYSLSLLTANTKRMTIDPNGHVGLATGTNAPRSVLDVRGQITGGFGAQSTSGNLDWNDGSNARPGSGYTLLFGNASNGPGPAVYFHPFSFEYGAKDGSGQLTQLAIPYSISSHLSWGLYIRGRNTNQWSNWRRVLTEQESGRVGTTRFTSLLVDGNVGLGTTNPTAQLHLQHHSRTFPARSYKPYPLSAEVLLVEYFPTGSVPELA